MTIYQILKNLRIYSFINSDGDFKFTLFEYFPFAFGSNCTEISISLSSSCNPVEYEPYIDIDIQHLKWSLIFWQSKRIALYLIS